VKVAIIPIYSNFRLENIYAENMNVKFNDLCFNIISGNAYVFIFVIYIYIYLFIKNYFECSFLSSGSLFIYIYTIVYKFGNTCNFFASHEKLKNILKKVLKKCKSTILLHFFFSYFYKYINFEVKKIL